MYFLLHTDCFALLSRVINDPEYQFNANNFRYRRLSDELLELIGKVDFDHLDELAERQGKSRVENVKQKLLALNQTKSARK